MSNLIPTDEQIMALAVLADTGALAAFKRSGKTVKAAKVALLAVRNDCALCGRPMTLDGTGDALAEIHHSVPRRGTDSGWIMSTAAINALGHAALFMACAGCNRDAGERIILPSELLHADHWVTRSWPVVARSADVDPYREARRDRLGW